MISQYATQMNNEQPTEETSMTDAELAASTGVNPTDTTAMEQGISFGDLRLGSEASGELANSGMVM